MEATWFEVIQEK